MLSVTHFTDPGCPWAYSAWPALATLQWRYGDQLEWEHVMIGLAEDTDRYEAAGYTPTRMATGYQNFSRTYGMPVGSVPRPRVSFTGYACRAVVAVRRLAPELTVQAIRALQFAQFCTPVLFDTEEGVREALAAVPGLDVDIVIATMGSDENEAAYQEDRAKSRSAEGGATDFQGKAAASDGPVRYTAPSLILDTGSASLEAGGFQSLEAYDVCVANLDRTLSRRGPSQDVVEILSAFDHPLTTAEVAQIMAPSLTAPDRDAATDALIAAAAAGTVTQQPLGNSALWAVA